MRKNIFYLSLYITFFMSLQTLLQTNSMSKGRYSRNRYLKSLLQKFIINWIENFAALTRKHEVKLAAPKNHFAKDLSIIKGFPVFLTSITEKFYWKTQLYQWIRTWHDEISLENNHVFQKYRWTRLESHSTLRKMFC